MLIMLSSCLISIPLTIGVVNVALGPFTVTIFSSTLTLTPSGKLRSEERRVGKECTG